MRERILLAVALQRYAVIPPPALAVRDLAADIARAQHAPLTVLTVHTPVDQMPEIESTRAKLKQFVEPLVEMGISVESTVREGSPRVLIQEVAREIRAGLIIMGTHIKRGILDTPLGGTAQAVMKGAPCRVLFLVPTIEESEETRRLIIPDYPFVFPYGL
jgi:nucleotide-binding universal stress UspA family protein